MKIYKTNTKMLYKNELVIIVGHDLDIQDNLEDLNYYVLYADTSKRNPYGNFYDLMVHHYELSPLVKSDILMTSTPMSNVVKTLEQNSIRTNEKIRHYVALVSNEYKARHLECPIYLGMHHCLESVSEEQIRATIARMECIPMQNVTLLPLDPNVSTEEWCQRGRILGGN